MKIKIQTTRDRVIEEKSLITFMNSAICSGPHYHAIKGDSGLLISFFEKYKPSLTLTGYSNDNVISLLCSGMSRISPTDKMCLLKYLLTAYESFDINAKNGCGVPPLVYALRAADINIIRCLLENSASILVAAGSLHSGQTIHSQISHDAEIEQILKDALYKEISNTPAAPKK